jgi:uncharacterized protein
LSLATPNFCAGTVSVIFTTAAEAVLRDAGRRLQQSFSNRFTGLRDAERCRLQEAISIRLFGGSRVSEKKYLDLQLSELKFANVDTTGEFSGYGSTFGNVDQGGDVVAPGAFAKSLDDHRARGSAPAMLWAHDPAQVIGKWESITEDRHGLAVKGVLAPTPKGQEVRALLKMGAVTGMSIGYRTGDAEYNRDGARVLKQLELHEISVVSMPMNRNATVTAAKNGGFESIKEWERGWRESRGWSRSRASRFASATWKHYTEAEHGGEIADLQAQLEEFDTQTAIRILQTAAQRIRNL